MKVTKGDIDRLGEKIANSDYVSKEDLDSLQNFRKTYKDPLSRTFEVLRALAIKIDKEVIVTYRIKRIDTIIRKLVRFKNNDSGRMMLSRMWDIAGCRCIFNTNKIEDIYLLKEKLFKEFGDFKINDYVKTPKKDGYSSLHLYIEDKISNKKIEVQIRTTKQHNWATLVEIIDLIFGTKIKEGERNSKLTRFLFLFSNRDSLNGKEKEELIRIERKFRIFRKMSRVFSKNYTNIRRQWISMEKNRGSYYVIEAKSDLSSTISMYSDFESAEDEYYNKYTSNSESNIVLTYIQNAKYKQISKAYSNYVLTMHSFFEEYKSILEKQILVNLTGRKFVKLWISLNCYRKTTLIYLKNITTEIRELNGCLKDQSIKRYHKQEWEKDLVKDIELWKQSTESFINAQKSLLVKDDRFAFLIRMQFKLLSMQIK